MATPAAVRLDVDLDYALTDDDVRGDPRVPGSGVPTPGHATRLLLREATHARFPQGLEGSDRRVFGRIDRRLAALLGQPGPPAARVLELDGREFEFVYKTVEGAKVRAAVACWWDVLMDALDEAKDERRRAEKTAESSA